MLTMDDYTGLASQLRTYFDWADLTSDSSRRFDLMRVEAATAIETLVRERDEAVKARDGFVETNDQYINELRGEAAAASREAAELRKALEPIVASYLRDAEPIGDSDLYDEQPRSVRLTLGDLRRARAALIRAEASAGYQQALHYLNRATVADLALKGTTP